MKAIRQFVRLKLTAENGQDLGILEQMEKRLLESKALSSFTKDGVEQIADAKPARKGK